MEHADNSQEIQVSVFCICYNHEPYIRDCMDGFVAQKTNFKFEVLVHDDASTDDTAAIIREYASKYPEIIKPILQTENQHSQGIKITKTFLLPHAKGKYIAICEGDDFWIDPEKLQKQYDYLEQHEECIGCVGGTKIIDYYQNQKERYLFPTEESRYVTTEEAIRHGNTYPTATFFYRSSHWHTEDYFSDLNLSFGDYQLALNLCFKGKLYAFHEVFSAYRRGVPGSWTVRNQTLEKFISVREQNALLMERVNQITNNQYEETTKQVILQYDFAILLKQGRKLELIKSPYRQMFIERYGRMSLCKTLLVGAFPFLAKLKKMIKRKTLV